MLKQQAAILRRIAITLDVATLIGAFILAFYLRRIAGTVGYLHDYDWLLLFAIPFWIILLNHFKLYESLRLRTYFDIAKALFNVHFIGGIALAAILFLLDPHHYSRILFGSFILINFTAMLAVKLLIKMILAHFRRRGFNYRNILIVGTGPGALKIGEIISEHGEWGLNVVGLAEIDDKTSAVTANSFPVVGSVRDLISICKERMIDEVIFALEKESLDKFEELLQGLQELGMTIRVVLDYLPQNSSKSEVSLYNNELPVLTYSNISLNYNQQLAKRFLDIIGALVGLALTVLMLPFIALAIKLDSPGPVFFCQPRVRENGRRFMCWKFRTMCLDAEEQKKKLMALNEMKGAMFKLAADPRVTSVGRFLRKTSLDEFPQFWNVLLGEMSLVGTRPPTPEEVENYQNWHRKRISIKPGITGLWQVSGRNRVQDFDEVVRLDIIYIETWTIWLDLRIILKTPLVMLSRDGAS